MNFIVRFRLELTFLYQAVPTVIIQVKSQILSSHIEDIIMKNNIKTLKLVLGNKEVKTLITSSLKSKNENTS